MIRPPPISTLFPYTTLFRSKVFISLSFAIILIICSITSVEREIRDILIINFGKFNSVIQDRKSTRLNSSHSQISYAVFCLKKKTNNLEHQHPATQQRSEHHA